MSATEHTEGRALLIDGLVQGVGFRPFVYRLATQEGLAGSVCNGADGVHVELFGTPRALERFRHRLEREAPALARIDRVLESPLSASEAHGFEIVASRAGKALTGVVPDAAICAQCRVELLDRADRRYRYPFISCTACGPRYSILQALPCDRINTAMRAFPPCAACRAEYENMVDRRFHAQAIACADCGPRVWLEVAGRDREIATGEDAIEAVQARLRHGGICAIKGIGGFHLACDARNVAAIARLREGKRRAAKPFAVMARDSIVARRHCRFGDTERALLESASAPIVLLDRRQDDDLPDSLAPGLNRLGVMLAYSPLHVLLLEAFDQPLVMTSGNAGGEPQHIDNNTARSELAALADVFLMHDREIINRTDDSVVQLAGGETQVLRRARGHAPCPLPLPPGLDRDHPSVVAFGGDIKNAFAVATAGDVVLSRQIGDLNRLSIEADLEDTLARFRSLHEFDPEIVAADLHPAYLSTRCARTFADAWGTASTGIAHHHAHAASCMAEHRLAFDHPPILALVQDGIGMGENSELWGAELLACTYDTAVRRATLEPAALPGGDRAAREPWRNLLARLDDAFGDPAEWPAVLQSRLSAQPVDTLLGAVRAKFNSPGCSSAGRLFDAVAAAIGLSVARQDHEGEAAMGLQAAAEDWLAAHAPPSGYRFARLTRADGVEIVSPRPIWAAIAADLDAGVDPGEIAARFHLGWASAWCELVLESGSRSSCASSRASERAPCRPPGDINSSPVVVLSGGTLQNRLLASLLRSALASAGLRVLEHREIPANDGGLAVGQVVIALARRRAAES